MFFKASLSLLLLVSVRAQTCVDNTFICSDCTNLVACFGGTEYPITCTAGQVCGNDGSDPTIDGCFDSTDSSNTKQSQCSCDASATGPTYMADGLSDDPAAYLACLPGNAAPESLVCATGEVYLDGQNPPCGTAPTTPEATTPEATTTPEPFDCTSLAAGESGFVADPNDCSKYWLCTSNTDTSPSEASCPAGESFNEGTLACFDPCDSSAETFSCDGITGGVADSIDCTIFHICVNGAAVGVPVPCATGEIFDEATSGCVTGTTCATATNECLICQTTVAPSTVSGATAATSGPDSSTDGSDSTADSGSSSDTSTKDSGSTDDSDSTADSDTSASTSDSGSSVSDSDSSASNPDSSTDSPTTASGVTGVPDCSSATQAGYYANSASCSVFYSCESDDAGGYVLKEYTCPGSLVFDPVNNYCNLASLVPGC